MERMVVICLTINRVKRMINRQALKQVFGNLAKKIVDLENTQIGVEGEPNTGSPPLPTIRWGRVQTPSMVEACAEAVDEVVRLSSADPAWSTSTIYEIVWSFADRISELGAGDRDTAIRSAVAEWVRRFEEVPASWVVDLLVYGLHGSCDGQRFGKLRFLTEQFDNTFDPLASLRDFPQGNQVFARLQASAIDEVSAIEKAANIVDEHLLILNALFSQVAPSWMQVSRDDHIRRFYSANRIGKLDAKMGPIRTFGHHRRMPLTGAEMTQLLRGELGSRVSRMLEGAETEFNARVLSGYQFVGAGCVDSHPERSFLMLTIALESVVLGKDIKSELTYQLGARVAHLIGNGLSGRKLVAKTVGRLYDRRSKIVHSGQCGVSRQDAASLHFYCVTALGLLVLSPAFAGFTTNTDLENWFRDRMLDGPNHFPEPTSNWPVQ
jgi:hypothetical protein